ncbi:hypothetical protein VDGE_01923 [Verticillium dahliae]|uniref:Cryptic loci regulator 2 N-terminal domain-containing protein n=1 Tax=Verticillium dahliae TaxID=27337 RepID=A0A444SA68_VERDA|nr:hypothetical protein VDGE_01923 [Verticillium dahliae]
MSDLQEFHVIRIAHSDGQDTGPGYWPVDAAKTAKKPGAAIADKTPRTKPQMARLEEDDPRFVEWRVKLGLLLKQELSLSPQEGLPWYIHFPRGYWLYEKSKHLWVSGYPIKSKLFKSPQEFGVHLLWLLSGSKDHNDCCCVHCIAPRVANMGDELSVQEPAAAVASTIPPPAPASAPLAGEAVQKSIANVKAPSATPTPTATPPLRAVQPPPVATSAPSLTPIQTPVPVPVPVPAHAPAPVQAPAPAPASAPAPVPQPPPTVSLKTESPVPVPIVPTVNTLVPFNQSMSSLFFRTGEMVWYSVTPSWRIGLIAKSNPQTKQVDILPISHALFDNMQLQAKPETGLRPFLAFTVPPVSQQNLGTHPFDEVPWADHIAALQTDPSKREPLLLDASKLAAVKISMSFSLFSKLPTSSDSRKVNYQGAFLGAERIEVGDTLRIRASPDINIAPDWLELLAQGGALLGLREICTAADNPGTVFFKGDLYAPLSTDAPGPPSASAVTPSSDVPETKLPRALREEMLFRAKAAPASRWRLHLLRRDIVLREPDVRGRFYPSARLLPVLMSHDTAGLQRELQQGVVRDSARFLNQRMDTFREGYIGRKRSRLDAIGAAVPHGAGALFTFEPVVVEEPAAAEGMLLS